MVALDFFLRISENSEKMMGEWMYFTIFYLPTIYPNFLYAAYDTSYSVLLNSIANVSFIYTLPSKKKKRKSSTYTL